MLFKGTCRQCRKDFEKELPPSKALRKNPFCSVDCRLSYQKVNGTSKKKYENKLIDVPCDVCSKTFQVEMGIKPDNAPVPA